MVGAWVRRFLGTARDAVRQTGRVLSDEVPGAMGGMVRRQDDLAGRNALPRGMQEDDELAWHVRPQPAAGAGPGPDDRASP